MQRGYETCMGLDEYTERYLNELEEDRWKMEEKPAPLVLDFSDIRKIIDQPYEARD